MINLKISNADYAVDLIKTYDSEENSKWIKHSFNTAACAYAISSAVSADIIDAQLAYRCGLLHDIGRCVPNSYMRHTVIGYNILSSKGYEKEAGVCLTHSYYLNDVAYYQGINNCNQQEINFIASFLNNHSLDIYDKLIQLCDTLATCERVCIVEERLVDVVMRMGFKEYTTKIWKTIFSIKQYFDDLCGTDIYNIIL